MNVLFLTTVLPLRNASGGEIVTDMLVKRFENNSIMVDVVGYTRPSDEGKICPDNYTSVETRIIETQGEKLKSTLWLVSAMISNVGLSTKKYQSNKYVSIVNEKLKNKNYDHIIVDHTQMLWITKWLPDSVNKIFISHNVESNLYSTLAGDASNQIKRCILRRESKKMKFLELLLVKKFNQIWALSDDDLNYYRRLYPGTECKYVKFDPLPAITPPENKAISPEVDISILGTWTWDANMQGLRWFFKEVYPVLNNGIRIRVAGKGADWLKDKYGNVEYCGFVDSAEEFMLNSKLVIIPSVAGAGVQIKTLDAITVGRPTIATSFALRGLVDKPSYVYEVNHPKEMAVAIHNKLKHDFTDEELARFSDECSSWFESKEIKIDKIINKYLGGMACD